MKTPAFRHLPLWTAAIAVTLCGVLLPAQGQRRETIERNFRISKVERGELYETKTNLKALYDHFKEIYDKEFVDSSARKGRNDPLLILRKVEDSDTNRNLYLARASGTLCIAEFPGYLSFKDGELTPRMSITRGGYFTTIYDPTKDGPNFTSADHNVAAPDVEEPEKTEEPAKPEAEDPALVKKREQLEFFGLPLRPWHLAKFEAAKKQKEREKELEKERAKDEIKPKEFRVYKSVPAFKYWIPGAPAQLTTAHFRKLVTTMGKIVVEYDEGIYCRACAGGGKVIDKEKRQGVRSATGKINCDVCGGTGKKPVHTIYTITK